VTGRAAWLPLPSRGLRASLAVAIASAGVPVFAGADGKAAPTLELGGRLQLDHDRFDGVYSDSGRRRTATYLRRARIETSGRLSPDWKYVLDVDLEGGGKFALQNASLAYGGLPAGDFRVGRFKPDFGLEQAISSRWTTAIERSAIWDLSPDVADTGEGFGVQFANAGRRHHVSVGGFDKPGVDSLVVRAVFAPIASGRSVLHLGLSYGDEDAAAGDGRIRTRLGVRGVTEHDDGNRITLARSLDDGTFAHDRSWALEFAYAAGPFSVQAERLQRRLAGADISPDRVATGHYVQLAWTLTGEARPYDIDGAKFERLAPARTRGAWELFYRRDRLGVRGEAGLSSGDRSGERASVDVFGLNWYVDDSLRVASNLLRAHTEGIANGVANQAGDALSVHMQWVF